MSIISTETIDQARTLKRARMQTREARIDNAIDAFQSVVLDLNVCRAPTYAQSTAVGRARKELLAAIAARDRAERLEA